MSALVAGLILNAASAVLCGPPAFAQTTESRPSTFQIREIQEMLTALGHDAGPADGVAGARTTAAVIAFQQREGLPQTGRMDVALFRALAARVAGIRNGESAATRSATAADGGAAVPPTVEPVASVVAPPVAPAVSPDRLPGTLWEIADADGSRQTVRFGADGSMAEALMPQFWKWRIDGAQIIMEFDNEAGGRVRRIGRFTGPGTIAGTAESSRGGSWEWTASRR